MIPHHAAAPVETLVIEPAQTEEQRLWREYCAEAPRDRFGCVSYNGWLKKLFPLPIRWVETPSGLSWIAKVESAQTAK